MWLCAVITDDQTRPLGSASLGHRPRGGALLAPGAAYTDSEMHAGCWTGWVGSTSTSLDYPSQDEDTRSRNHDLEPGFYPAGSPGEHHACILRLNPDTILDPFYRVEKWRLVAMSRAAYPALVL